MLLARQEDLLVLDDGMAQSFFKPCTRDLDSYFVHSMHDYFTYGNFLNLELIINPFQMYTQYVNGYDKAMSVFQDTMKENAEFANLVSQFQVRDCH